MSITLDQIVREFQSDLFGEPAPVKVKKSAAHNPICLECAASLFDYTANDAVKFKTGICCVCNEEKPVTDARHFNIKLKGCVL